jgi:hypothetical protein
MRCRWIRRPSVLIAIGLFIWSVAPVTAQQPAGQQIPGRAAEQNNMRLVGYNDLQARSAYQPIIQRQGNRWIAYIGHHGGEAPNPLTGQVEPNGTSIVDVTDPAQPRYLHHIPGGKGAGEAGGAQMVRACEGKDLPKGAPGRTYMLRTNGNLSHEIWDVTDPGSPAFVATVVTGLNGTHKNWWECDTGIAYLVSDGRPSGWRSSRITKIYDLSDPAHPRFIRDFGLPGQEPGSSGPVPEDKLLRGDPTSSNPLAPTPANLLYPQIGRLEMSPNWGGHTSLPILGVEISDFSKNLNGRVRNFVLMTSESTGNRCQEYRHLVFLVDITTESRPFSVSNFQVPESSGSFCDRGGRFGPHATNESFTPTFYKKIVFISYFNAGVRAVDIRDPYRPSEVAFYIPATTGNTDRRCARIGGTETCKVDIQTNNVEVDERGFIYIVDRANTGMHILELTGSARAIIER